MIDSNALQQLRLSLLEQIALAADEIEKIDDELKSATKGDDR